MVVLCDSTASGEIVVLLELTSTVSGAVVLLTEAASPVVPAEASENLLQSNGFEQLTSV